MGVVSCALPVLVGALLALSPWAHAQTELTLVTWFEPGSLDPVIEAFEAENPDIRVVVNFVAGPRESFEAVLVRTAGGAPPDLAMVQHGERALAMTSDIFLDLAPYIQRDLQIEEYLPEIVRFWN
ncbi:MAG TPA: ABC transporter substrate-binding protein, partial [Limnochordia bacterium]|nr:ABC transporter substrate-binding protein [Limnochordia bacterium]